MFPQATLKKMSDAGIKEADIYDVYNNGKPLTFSSGAKGMQKEYKTYGYLIGCIYAPSRAEGEYSIIGVWKRKIV